MYVCTLGPPPHFKFHFRRLFNSSAFEAAEDNSLSGSRPQTQLVVRMPYISPTKKNKKNTKKQKIIIIPKQLNCICRRKSLSPAFHLLGAECIMRCIKVYTAALDTPPRLPIFSIKLARNDSDAPQKHIYILLNA